MATLLDLLVLLFTALEDVPGLVAQIAGWSRDEAREYLRRVWGLMRLAVLAPFVLLLGGALAGGIEEWGPLAKTILVYASLGFAAVMALMLAWRAIPLTAILAAIIEASRSGPARFYTPAETTAKWYVALVGAILTNELWIGMVVWIAPIHNKPEFIFPVIVLSLILTAYVLWKGGMEWYPKVIYASTLLLLLALIASFWFPNTAAKVQAFEPEKWWEQTLEKREQEKRQQQAAATGMTAMGLKELCPGDEYWLEAGVTRAFQIGERGGCNVRDIKIPTLGRVKVTWIYPGGEEESMEMKVGDGDSKLTRRPSALRVLALEKAAFKAL